MKPSDVVWMRMVNERLMGKGFERAEDVVRWFGAVQAQDFAGAKWGVGQRVRRADDAAVDDAFQRGAILRTHVLRPTWHFVLPEDIRWMLALTAPRVRRAVAYYDRQLELDAAVLRRCRAVFVKALSGHEYRTREELSVALGAAGIVAKGQRLGHIMMHAELDAVVCSGPRHGKQFTYALLDERAPKASPRTRDEALHELTVRYFTSHGPAQVVDFAWWSGLTTREAKEGIALAELASETIESRTYWLAADAPAVKKVAGTFIHLLPNYDEFLIAYKDHTSAFDAAMLAKFREVRTKDTRDHFLSNHLVVQNGRVIGGWKRVPGKAEITVEVRLLERQSPAGRVALKKSVLAFEAFVGTPVRLILR
jgi:hypothetical protein